MLSPKGLTFCVKTTQSRSNCIGGVFIEIPEIIIDAFPNKVINIHPALLPKYGGKGMYGIHVHKAL